MRFLDEAQRPKLAGAMAAVPANLRKPSCRALFTFLGSRYPTNPEELMTNLRFRNGLGISVRSPLGGSWHPCRPWPGERPQTRVTAFMAGPYRATVFLCDDFFRNGDSEGSMTFVHEMLHASGMPEDMNSSTATILSSEEIAAMVRRACR